MRRARRRRRRRRSYAPYEALLLFDDAKTVLADLPKSVTPQLRQLLAAAAPTASFHALAASTGLPLSRVYRLARHLVEWKKARVVTVVRSDSVYAVDDRAPAVPDGGDELRRRRALAVLAAFGPARRLGDALDDLERRRVPDATKTVLRLLTSGHLRELHTYVLRIDGAPPPGLEAAANAAVAPGAGFRLSLDDRDDDSLHGRQPRPAAGDAGAPHHLRLLHMHLPCGECLGHLQLQHAQHRMIRLAHKVLWLQYQHHPPIPHHAQQPILQPGHHHPCTAFLPLPLHNHLYPAVPSPVHAL